MPRAHSWQVVKLGIAPSARPMAQYIPPRSDSVLCKIQPLANSEPQSLGWLLSPFFSGRAGLLPHPQTRPGLFLSTDELPGTPTGHQLMHSVAFLRVLSHQKEPLGWQSPPPTSANWNWDTGSPPGGLDIAKSCPFPWLAITKGSSTWGQAYFIYL